MKKIEAIIRKTKFEEVKEALLGSDIDWFEYHDVHGIGQSRQERVYRGVQYSTDVIERARRAGAAALLLPNIDEASIEPMMAPMVSLSPP